MVLILKILYRSLQLIQILAHSRLLGPFLFKLDMKGLNGILALEQKYVPGRWATSFLGEAETTRNWDRRERTRESLVVLLSIPCVPFFLDRVI
jgi:hypothetical protein